MSEFVRGLGVLQGFRVVRCSGHGKKAKRARKGQLKRRATHPAAGELRWAGSDWTATDSNGSQRLVMACEGRKYSHSSTNLTANHAFGSGHECESVGEMSPILVPARVKTRCGIARIRWPSNISNIRSRFATHPLLISSQILHGPPTHEARDLPAPKKHAKTARDQS
jgi:hypothetical protein